MQRHLFCWLVPLPFDLPPIVWVSISQLLWWFLFGSLCEFQTSFASAQASRARGTWGSIVGWAPREEWSLLCMPWSGYCYLWLESLYQGHRAVLAGRVNPSPCPWFLASPSLQAEIGAGSLPLVVAGDGLCRGQCAWGTSICSWEHG